MARAGVVGARVETPQHAARLEQMVGPSVRAGLISAAARAGVDSGYLQRRLEHEDELVAAVTAIFLRQRDALDRRVTRRRVRHALRHVSGAGAVVGRALAEAEATDFEDVVLELLESHDLPTRRAAIACTPFHPSSAVALALRNQLDDRELRPHVRDALVELDEKGFAALRKSLADVDLDARIRWQVPSALRAFGTRAAASMWEAFKVEADGVVRYRLLLELERLHAQHPDLGLDPDDG